VGESGRRTGLFEIANTKSLNVNPRVLSMGEETKEHIRNEKGGVGKKSIRIHNANWSLGGGKRFQLRKKGGR